MKGILFRPEIWQAKLRVLEEYGEAQIRRVIKPQPQRIGDAWYWRHPKYNNGAGVHYFHSQYISRPILEAMAFCSRYQEGEVVYVKEAFCQSCYKDGLKDDSGQDFVCYQADLGSYWKGQNPCLEGGWTSPLFMPAKFARYFLQITKVEAERVQGITEEDAIKEGVEALYKTQSGTFGAGYIWTPHGHIDGFINIWNSLNPKYPWETNPWEFTYTIKLVER